MFSILTYADALNPDYSPPDLLRWPQTPRLQRFVRSGILTVQASTFPVRSVTKTLHSRGLEPPRDDPVMNNPGLNRIKLFSMSATVCCRSGGFQAHWHNLFFTNADAFM